jgi:hypothetical protein
MENTVPTSKLQPVELGLIPELQPNPILTAGLKCKIGAEIAGFQLDYTISFISNPVWQLFQLNCTILLNWKGPSRIVKLKLWSNFVIQMKQYILIAHAIYTTKEIGKRIAKNTYLIAFCHMTSQVKGMTTLISSAQPPEPAYPSILYGSSVHNLND